MLRGAPRGHDSSVANLNFRSKIRKSGFRNSIAYRLQNSRKRKFATELFPATRYSYLGKGVLPHTPLVEEMIRKRYRRQGCLQENVPNHHSVEEEKHLWPRRATT